MLSLLPSAGSAVPSAVVVADHQRGPSNNPSTAHTAREQPFYSNRVTGLCPHPNSMGGNSGPALPRIPPLIMPPLTTSTCSSSSTTGTAATGDYSPPSPRLYPSPYSPAGVPYFAQSSTSSSSSSATSHHPHPSSPAAPSAHYYFPFTHPNPYSRHYIQIDPNYSAVALAASLQNPSAAAQLRPYPRPAPIFAVSTGNPSTSPSPNQYSVFPFPPSHHLSLHPPPMTPFTSSAVPSTSTSEHSSSLPLFGVAPNNSPVRLTSISPDDRSPSSVSPHSQISRHSSSPNVISAGGPKGGVVAAAAAAATTAAVDVPHSSSTPTQPSVSFSAASISNSRSLSCSSSNNGTGSAGGGGVRDLSLKHRLLIRPSVNSQQGQNQDVAQHHRHQHHQHQRNAAFLNVNSCQLPSTSLPSNSIISHVNLDHVVNKLRSSTPKRSKSSSTSSSSTSSSSTASSTSRPPSSQPPTTPSAVAAITHSNNPAVQPSSAAAAAAAAGNNNSSVKLMYPAHFNKGSIIQLTGGELKCVEDLCTEDFVKSAEQSGNLQIDSSTVVRIDSVNNLGKNGSTVVLGFAVGVQKLQVSVEASLEHPFFVFGKGWSSCSPPRTLQRYSLPCHQLIVGDVCISLTHKQNYQRKTSASTAATIAADGCLDNRVISTASPINNLNTNVIPKTLCQRGTGAKRKRRWSESDANEYRVLPKSDHSSGHDAAAVASALRIQPPLNQSCK